MSSFRAIEILRFGTGVSHDGGHRLPFGSTGAVKRPTCRQSDEYAGTIEQRTQGRGYPHPTRRYGCKRCTRADGTASHNCYAWHRARVPSNAGSQTYTTTRQNGCKGTPPATEPVDVHLTTAVERRPIFGDLVAAAPSIDLTERADSRRASRCRPKRQSGRSARLVAARRPCRCAVVRATPRPTRPSFCRLVRRAGRGRA